jgi:phospholipid transport system substrate-binding protein
MIPAVSSASDEEHLKQVMTQKANSLYEILRHPEYDKPTRQQKVLAEVEPLFDFKLMSRFALESRIWKSLTKEQRSNFSDLFISHIKQSYLNKIDLFADTEVTVKSSDRVKKNRIQVTTILVSKTEEKEVIYKFYQTQYKEWLIYDVDVVGVSFLQSYRSQFSSYLKTHSFEELLDELRKDDSSIKDN